MKKLVGLTFAMLLITAPLVGFAQVQASAGSMKIGVHLDVNYRWSAKSNEDGTGSKTFWDGYDTVTAQNLDLEITGKIGDRVNYKVLEALVYEFWDYQNSKNGFTIQPYPSLVAMGPAALPLEAYVDLKAIDQLKFRIGEFATPTLIANTPVHMANVVHTANQPLIASSILGYNQVQIDKLALSFPAGKINLPGSVTGIATIISFSGLELNWTIFDNWLLGTEHAGDLGFDPDKSKGNNIALTYAGAVGKGKLTARAFWNDERVNFGSGALHPLDNSSWGVGVIYNSDKFFAGAEYASDTKRFHKDVWFNTLGENGRKASTWNGYYVMVGGNFGAIQPVYRLDSIDYTSLTNKQIPGIQNFDSEIWHTFALNYLVNDSATIGIDYVIKDPEEMKGVQYPNINELLIMVELNTL